MYVPKFFHKSQKNIKESSNKKFGCDYPFQNKNIQKKIKESFRNKYGVDNPIQVPEFFQKMLKMMPEKKEGITKCKWLTPSEIVLIMKDSRPLVHYLLEFVLQDPDYKNFRKVWKKL